MTFENPQNEVVYFCVQPVYFCVLSCMHLKGKLSFKATHVPKIYKDIWQKNRTCFPLTVRQVYWKPTELKSTHTGTSCTFLCFLPGKTINFRVSFLVRSQMDLDFGLSFRITGYRFDLISYAWLEF